MMQELKVSETRNPVTILRDAGYVVERSAIPGLVWVNGHELTMNQTKHMALMVETGGAIESIFDQK